MTIMSQRENLEFEGAIESDCASVHGLVACMLPTSPNRAGTNFIHCLRDPTRGGVATTLNEIAKRAGVKEASNMIEDLVGRILATERLRPSQL
jgi:hydrogenase expression/formation protein HypE